MAKKQVDAKLLISFLSQSQLDITHLSDVLEVLNKYMFPYRRWFELGLLLGILQPTLAKIELDHRYDVVRCLQECLTCWLRRVDKVGEIGRPSWDVLATTLKKMEENFVAENITQTVKQVLIYPVEMSQLLYSKRCISEMVLDDVETLDDLVDNKRITLMSAIHTAVSSDHKYIKVLAEVLSEFEETKQIADKLLNEYTQKFPKDEDILTIPQNTCNYQQSASEILRCHYATLSKSLYDPISVGWLLCEQDPMIISEETLSSTESTKKCESERRIVLLRAVRCAVRSNSNNLEVFVSVLLKFTENVVIAKAILNDYNKELERKKKDQDPSIDDVKTEVLIPLDMAPTFTSIRGEFAKAVFNICSCITKSQAPAEEIKRLLYGFPNLKPEISNAKTINDILDIVCDKCTLINISYLEVVVEQFNIEDAKTYVKSYQDIVDKFSQKVAIKLCLGERFQITQNVSPLKCETAKFVLDWNPDDTTLNDVRNILAVSFQQLEKSVRIDVIKKDNSITVTCNFPRHLFGRLVAIAQETIELVKKRGLIRLIIGPCIIWDINSRDQEIKSLAMEIKENSKTFEKQLETQYAIGRRKTLEIEDLRAKLKHQEVGLHLLKKTSEQQQVEIKKLRTILQEKEASEKALSSKVVQYEEEVKSLQEMIISLTSKSKERGKDITVTEKTTKVELEMKGMLKATKDDIPIEPEPEVKEKPLAFLQSLLTRRKSQSMSDDIPIEFEDKEKSSSLLQHPKGDSGSVEWESDSVILTSSTVAECKEVIHQLKRRQDTTWEIELKSLSSQSLLTLLNDINECQVRSLSIENTHFDSNCVGQLTQVVTYNKTMEELRLWSSPLLPDTYQLLTISVTYNKIIKKLWLTNDNNISDKDIPHFCHLITNNKTLEELYLTNCPNITKFGEKQLQNVCVKNNTLNDLWINGNWLRYHY